MFSFFSTSIALWIEGISSRQGLHHVAQKLMKTVLPLYSEKSTTWPFRSSNFILAIEICEALPDAGCCLASLLQAIAPSKINKTNFDPGFIQSYSFYSG